MTNPSLFPILEKFISKEATKLALRHHDYHNELAKENDRKKRRGHSINVRSLQKPNYWKNSKLFNPFYVKKHAKTIAYAIANKIENRLYSPNETAKSKIKKLSGGYREVDIYQIPDAAVSNLFYYRLLAKNKHRLSSFSYAYRNDRNIHFAIQDISLEFSKYSRVYVAEFDFSKFFDNISHDYLFNQFNKNGFFVTDEERYIIESFLPKNKKSGIPQGTSISLFLANLVCWELDKTLEQSGLQFARYADDTIIWSNNYNKISKAYDIISEFSKNINIDINPKKSEGISIVCSDEIPSELTKSKDCIEFVGYSISTNSESNVSIKKSSVLKIKRQISYILYKHLIQPLLVNPLQNVIIPANNKDPALLGAISEIRRYLYGNLSDKLINDYLQGRLRRISFKGVMSFYPLVNNENQMKELDGWLVNAIYKALNKRKSLLKSLNYNRDYMFPFNTNQTEFLLFCSKDKKLKIPSFLLMHKALKHGLKDKGITGVTSPKSNFYNYFF